MRYATFYYNIITNQVSDLKVHSDKETALKCFNTNCRQYFQNNASWKALKLPATYGFPHRKYYGISARAFKKMFNISVDAALKLAQGGN